MPYNAADNDNVNAMLDKTLVEIIKVLTYSDNANTENVGDISEVIDKLIMDYLWRM